jgi:hypothetical protein
MRHYGRLFIALLIVVIILPAACGSLSLAGGRTFSISGSGVVRGMITSYETTGAIGATFNIPPGTGTISNALSNAADNDILHLEEGTYFDNVLIDKSLSITGAGATLTTVDGLHKGSVFTIPSGVTTTLADMTIQNGYSGIAGGIFNDGTINLNNILITRNTATYGGGIYNIGTITMNSGSSITGNTATYGKGSGIYNTGTITMIGSTISGNYAGYNASYYGGGIYNDIGGTVIMNGGAISENPAIYGGGIYNAGTVTMNGGTISDNSANNGGGILNYGTVTMNSKSSITSNIAYNGGGILNYGTVTMNSGSSITDNTGYTNGGGIYNTGMVTVNSGSSITGNIGQDGGGGVYNTGTIKMNGGTISDNKPDNVFP